METADALDSDHLAVHYAFACMRYRICTLDVLSDDVHLRSAVVAAHRLRIISSGVCMRVFVLALFAHREIAHRSAFPVVRHRIEYRQPRSALRAVDERVKIAPVATVEKLFSAFVAGGNVGRNENIACFLFTLDYLERLEIYIFRLTHISRDYYRSLWRFVFQDMHEPFKDIAVRFSEHLNIRAFVCDCSQHSERVRRP